jgi:hypothetical protein
MKPSTKGVSAIAVLESSVEALLRMVAALLSQEIDAWLGIFAAFGVDKSLIRLSLLSRFRPADTSGADTRGSAVTSEGNF